MDEVTLKTFPRTKSEALALLYVQSLDLTNVTPEELLARYNDACDRIKKADAKNSNWTV